MRQLVDTTYPFEGYFGCPSLCRLRIYADPHPPTVVVATECPDNPGTSVTDAAERLAARVVRQFGLDPDCLLWIEHHPDRAHYGGRPQFPERFDRVEFRRGRDGSFRKPRWSPIARAGVERLIGRTL